MRNLHGILSFMGIILASNATCQVVLQRLRRTFSVSLKAIQVKHNLLSNKRRDIFFLKISLETTVNQTTILSDSKILIERIFFRFYPRIKKSDKNSRAFHIFERLHAARFRLCFSFCLSFFIHLRYSRSIKSKANKGFKISIEDEMANRNSRGWRVYKFVVVAETEALERRKTKAGSVTANTMEHGTMGA